MSFDSTHAGARRSGCVVVEPLQPAAANHTRIGTSVVFDDCELLRLFDAMRVIHHEDTSARRDFGRRMTRVVAGGQGVLVDAATRRSEHEADVNVQLDCV